MSVQEIQKKIVPLLQSHGATRVGLFGSASREELQPGSDVDILVELPKGLSLLDFVGIKQELEQQLGRPVDLVEYEELKPRLREKILREQIALV